MDLRFHWMLPKGGEVALESATATALYRTRSFERTSPARMPDMEGWCRFARGAEEFGIESVLISCGPYEPDSLLTACALGLETETLKFIAAFRSGWMQPTTFVQQFNTLSQLVKGRVALNMVAGSSTVEQHAYGDYLQHDERYARAEEFLSVCNSFWGGDEEVNFDGKYYRIERRNPSHDFSGRRPPRPRNLCLGTFRAGATTGLFPGDMLVARGRHPRKAPACGGALSPTRSGGLPPARPHLPGDA